MPTTPNLGIPHIDASQNQKEVTANTAFDDLDAALTDLLVQAITDADYTVVTADALTHMLFKFTGTLTANRNIIVPNNKKMYVVANGTTGGFSLTVKTSAGTGVAISSTTYTFLYCDGTNVVSLGASLVGAITETSLSLSNVTTDDVSTAKHGFAPKAPNDATKFLDGTGAYSTPAGTGTQIGGVSRKTTDYTAVSGDSGTLIEYDSSAAHTLTLPAATPTATWFIVVKNINTGVLAIARNGLTIDGKSSNLSLTQGDSVMVFSDGSNYVSCQPRPLSVGVFSPGIGSNSQVLLYIKMDRACIFPASAPNSFGIASVAATGSTTFTLKKNGSSFATAVFSASGTTAAWTQASDAVFAPGDILEVDGPATADATLANIGITLQGYRF